MFMCIPPVLQFILINVVYFPFTLPYSASIKTMYFCKKCGCQVRIYKIHSLYGNYLILSREIMLSGLWLYIMKCKIYRKYIQCICTFKLINPGCIYFMFLITSISGMVMKQDNYQYMFKKTNFLPSMWQLKFNQIISQCFKQASKWFQSWQMICLEQFDL